MMRDIEERKEAQQKQMQEAGSLKISENRDLQDCTPEAPDRAERIREVCGRLQLSPSEKQVQQLDQYYLLLLETSRVMNLTTVTAFEDVLTVHFLDSLSIVKALPAFTAGQRIIDIGTGAGFPGIPLKILFPETEIVLVDSLAKRVRFLETVIERCGLEQISALHSRAEDLGHDPAFRQQFDCCVSRAVANLSSLCEYCLPFVRSGGVFVSYKSQKAEEEMKAARHAARLLGGRMPEKPVSFTLPGTDLGRSLVLIKKEERTPSAYPRKAGLPSRKPL